MAFKFNPFTKKFDYYPKLDDCEAPDDNTDLNASTSKHGLLLKLGGGTSNFLRADGTWNAPPVLAHTHDTDTLQLDGINSDGGAFAFTTSGAITFSQSILVDGGDIGITGDADLIGLASALLKIRGAVGIGTDTSPHGGVGYAKLSIEGTDANAAGPHVQFTTDANDYPLFQILPWGHDNVNFTIDGYYDGGWKSSDAGSSFQIAKAADALLFRYGVAAAGSAVTFTTGITMGKTGVVILSNDLRVDGGNIGISADTDLLGLADAALTVNGTLGLLNGTTINEFSIDGTFAGNSDDACPTEKATLTLVNAKKLDDLAAPDDNTDLNASTSKHGLLLKLGGGSTNFLRADGTWNAPVSAGVPAGAVIATADDAIPTGYLECDGSTISRSTYSDLFDVIGEMYGNGDGSTTFEIPDYRGKFIRGMDNSAGNDPDAAGRTDRGDSTTGDSVGTQQANEVKSHRHKHSYGVSVGGYMGHPQSSSVIGTVYGFAAYEGGNESRPINVNVIYCIKT